MTNRKTKQPEQQINNFVAKHMRLTSQPSVQIDQKKRDKRGYRKHRNQNWSE